MKSIDVAELARLRVKLARSYTASERERRASGLDGRRLARHLGVVGVLRVLVCTDSARLSEITGAKAEDLRPDGGLVVVGRTGSRVVHLNGEGQEVVRQHARLVGGVGFLFPGPNDRGHASGSAVNRALCRLVSVEIGRPVGCHALRQLHGRRRVLGDRG